jgi:phosphohistidine swiveling domain-containing protein
VSGFRWLVPLTSGPPPVIAGAKAARLSSALLAGFRVLPGWVLPVAAGRPAIGAGVAAIRADGVAAGRRAVLGYPLEPALAGELETAVTRLRGRVIVRSSSPLEADPRWSGAFSSVAEVGPADVAAAVRSCLASVLAPDPLRRLDSCGLPLEAAELAVLLQPEISPVAGGTARVTTQPDGDIEVTVEGLAGHPGALLAGAADGATARFRGGAVALTGGNGLVSLIGAEHARAVAELAMGVCRVLGDDLIEWALWQGEIWLLQSLRERPRSPAAPDDSPDAVAAGPPGAHPRPAPHASVLALAEAIRASGRPVPAIAAAPGATAGRLVACRPHEPATPDCRDAVLLIDRPLAAYAPLLFAARGVISAAGPASSHLATVARSLGVPMVVGCPVAAVTAGYPPASEWLAALDGGTGDVRVMAGHAVSCSP